MRITIFTLFFLNTFQIIVSQTSYQNDLLNRITLFTLPNGTTIQYTYDELGNRTSKKIAKGTVVQAKVFFEGPYNETSSSMEDHLREAGKIPLTEPFTTLGFRHLNGGGGEVLNSNVLKTTGNDAIVDWVFVELRDKNDPTITIATRSALLQRDGDIVEIDGISPLRFKTIGADNYYIALRHRNHLGLRSLNPVLPNTQSTLIIDFTNPATATYGINAQKNIAGKMCMYAGNANYDSQINAVDKNIYWRNQNGQSFDYLIASADFNLDGQINAVDKNLYWRRNNSIIQQLD